MKRLIFLALAFIIFLYAGLGAQEGVPDDIDSLFEGDEAGNIEIEKPLPGPAGTEGGSASPPPDHLGTFTREPLTFSGSVTTALGGLVGYTSYPDSPGYPGSLENLDVSGYANFANTLVFRARLDPTTSIQGSVTAEYPGYVLTVGELFIDYLLYERLFFRVGKQVNTWGNGRIYADTNLTVEAENGYSFKLTTPVSTGTLTTMIMDQPAWRYTDSPGARDLNYAGLVTVPVGPVEFLAMALYPSARRRDQGFPARGVLGVKTTLWSFDLFHESLLDKEIRYTALSGFFKEWNDPRVQLYGEYRAKIAENLPADHQTSLNILWKGVFRNQTDIGLRWNHAWRDGSGYVVPGLQFVPLPNLTVAFALPVYYGEPDSIIAAEYSDIDPRFRKLSFAAKATLSFSY